jgi:hypothetical protein
MLCHTLCIYILSQVYTTELSQKFDFQPTNSDQRTYSGRYLRALADYSMNVNKYQRWAPRKTLSEIRSSTRWEAARRRAISSPSSPSSGRRDDSRAPSQPHGAPRAPPSPPGAPPSAPRSGQKRCQPAAATLAKQGKRSEKASRGESNKDDV